LKAASAHIIWPSIAGMKRASFAIRPDIGGMRLASVTMTRVSGEMARAIRGMRRPLRGGAPVIPETRRVSVGIPRLIPEMKRLPATDAPVIPRYGARVLAGRGRAPGGHGREGDEHSSCREKSTWPVSIFGWSGSENGGVLGLLP
jgi:hypothetical protein